MATEKDFSAADWQRIEAAPFMAGLAISYGDMSNKVAIADEAKATGDAIKAGASSSSQIVQTIATRFANGQRPTLPAIPNQPAEAQHALEVGYPVGDEWFCSRDSDFAVDRLDRHDLQPFGVSLGNDLGDRADIQFQWIHMVIFDTGTCGQPDGQAFAGQQLPRGAQVVPFLLGNDDERMQVGAIELTILVELLGLVFFHDAIVDQHA